MKYDKFNKIEHDIKKDGLEPSGGKSAEEVDDACNKAWEKVHNELYRTGGVNPYAYKLGFFDGNEYAHQQPVQGEGNYRANFLFGFDDESIESLGYEFANGKTEEYLKECWDALLDKIKHQPVQGYSREQMEEYGKNILKSISYTFLNPENLKKASLNDQVVIQAVGETILNFPLPEIQQPVNDGWVRVDTPPDEGEVVLISDINDGWVCAGEYYKTQNKWYSQFSDKAVIPTHWRPLPEPPKQ